jgi:hypothetical protein
MTYIPLQQDIACHIPFQIGELFANQASLELMLNIVQQRYPVICLVCQVRANDFVERHGIRSISISFIFY